MAGEGGRFCSLSLALRTADQTFGERECPAVRSNEYMVGVVVVLHNWYAISIFPIREWDSLICQGASGPSFTQANPFAAPLYPGPSVRCLCSF